MWKIDTTINLGDLAYTITSIASADGGGFRSSTTAAPRLVTFTLWYTIPVSGFRDVFRLTSVGEIYKKDIIGMR